MTIYIPEWAVALGLSLGVPALMCACGWLMFRYGGHHGRWNLPVAIVAVFLIFAGVSWPAGVLLAAIWEYMTPIFLGAPVPVKFAIGALAVGGLGYAGYWLKKTFLLGYAAAEGAAGLFIAGFVIADVEGSLSTGEIFALVLALYLVVRGLTNYKKDLEDQKTAEALEEEDDDYEGVVECS